MKGKARKIQYTIRDVPQEIDAKRGQSLNKVILDELAAATGGHKAKADLSDVVGRWTPDEGFDEIISSQRQVDLEKWK